MPPSDRRVGALDHPYDRASVAVYQNSLGFYFKLDGCRKKVHGAQLWTSTSHVKMRGALPVGVAPAARGAARRAAPPHHAWDDDADDDDLAAAIAASLAEAGAAPMHSGGGDGGDGDGDGDGDAADGDGDAAGGGDAPGGGNAGGGGTCVVCLTEPAVMLMRPCNHVCGCTGCARRLVRRPCPMCRRNVTKTERVFF